MSSPVKAFTVYRKLTALREACRREGTPAIQKALDDVEDYWSHLHCAGMASEKTKETP